MSGDTPVVKQPAHENLIDAIRALETPDRLNDQERMTAMGKLIVHCCARVNDIIPDDAVMPICRDLLFAAVNAMPQIASDVWNFVVSQLGNEESAIALLDDICNNLDEGWVVVQQPLDVHMPMSAEFFGTEVAHRLEAVKMMTVALKKMGVKTEVPGLYDPIVARVGPQSHPDPEDEDTDTPSEDDADVPTSD